MAFIKKHPFITTNLICAIITLIFCAVEFLRYNACCALFLAIDFGAVIFIYTILVNAFAYGAFYSGKIKLGLIISVLGGYIGGFIAGRKKCTAVKTIFNVWIWVIVCITVSGAIYFIYDFSFGIPG